MRHRRDLCAVFAEEIDELLPRNAESVSGARIHSPTLVTPVDTGRLEPAAFLAVNDSYAFHDRAGSLLRTGPTGTNVSDVAVVLVR